MIADRCQRWRDRRESYRPAGETIATSLFEVSAIPDDTTARAFVEQHHYSGSFPAARRRFGLYTAGELVGVAVYSQPWAHVVSAAGLPFSAGDVLELSRFVLLDEVPANGETWFLARTTAELRRESFAAVLSFADDAARTAADGRQTFAGHIGTIYQALSATYRGRGSARTIRILPDGSILSDRAMTKIRKRERGWRGAVATLVAHGAAQPAEGADLRAWLELWRGRLTRRLKHPGCHRYIWPIDRRARRHLPAGDIYPKLDRANLSRST